MQGRRERGGWGAPTSPPSLRGAKQFFFLRKIGKRKILTCE